MTVTAKMVLIVALVASLLAVAESQVSNTAARANAANIKGFLSKYIEDFPAYSNGADASKTSHGNYIRFLFPSVKRMKHGIGPDTLSHHNNPYEHDFVDGSSASHTADGPFMILDDMPFHTTAQSANLMPMLSTRDHGTVNVVDRKKEEEKERKSKGENLEVKKMLASHKAKADTGMITIGMTLLAFATALAVRIRREWRPALVPTTGASHGSDILCPALDGHAFEFRSQGSTMSVEAARRQSLRVNIEEIEARLAYQEDRRSPSVSSNSLQRLGVSMEGIEAQPPHKADRRSSSVSRTTLRRWGVSMEDIEVQPPHQEDTGLSSVPRNLRVSVALLVDAKAVSIDVVKASLKALQGQGKLDSITMLANPGLEKSVQWRQFIEQYGIRFQARSRTDHGIKDANDNDIAREARRLASTQVQRIALLVYNADCIPLIKELQKLGKEPIVILPNDSMQATAERFEQMDVPVFFAEERVKKGRVLAVLEPDGTGKICVKEEDFEYPGTDADTLDFAARHLERLHYLKPGEAATGHALVPAVVKFWYANQLGSLTVFPRPILFREMRDVWLRNAGRHWLRQEEEFAFLLPRKAARGARNKAVAEERYGNTDSAAVANGGGPFLLQDSDTMVEQVLHELGYMDTSLNSDLNEAIQVFSSMSCNKRNLRRVGMTSADLYSYSSSMSKLRCALLSNESGGTWQLPPSDADVRQYFIAQGLLPEHGATRDDVLQVFKQYSRRLKLPNLKTYNGYVRSLVSRLNNPPPTGLPPVSHRPRSPRELARLQQRMSAAGTSSTELFLLSLALEGNRSPTSLGQLDAETCDLCDLF